MAHGSTNEASHSKEVSANSHTATTSMSGCGGYSKSMTFAPESWSTSVGRHIFRPDYLWDVNSRSSFHDRPDYSGMGVYPSNVGNGHGTFSTPFKGVMPGQSFGTAIEKFSGDIMNYLELKRKFAKYVENVYRDCDVCLTYLESLCVRVLQKNQVLKFSRAILPKHSTHFKNTMSKIFLKNIDNWGFPNPLKF